jgi:hypothetical protein
VQAILSKIWDVELKRQNRQFAVDLSGGEFSCRIRETSDEPDFDIKVLKEKLLLQRVN